MDPRMMHLAQYVKVPIELNAKPGNKVVIITDTNMDPLLWQTVAAVAESRGVEVSLFLMTPRAAFGIDPTPPISAAVRAADIMVDMTTRALGHAAICDEIRKAGKQAIYMNGATYDILSSGAATADYAAIEQLGQTLMALWTECKEVRVTSRLGTDLVTRTDGRKGFYMAARNRWLADGRVLDAAFPDGESGIVPLEGTGEGIVVWDTTVEQIGLLQEPVKLTVKKGWVVDVEGGAQARQIRELLEQHGDRNSYNCPAEISIGTNPKARITGSMREDKKKWGTSHIAFGTNSEDGGVIRAKLHIDGLIREPTVSMDGRVVVQDGAIKV
ncbi:MAG: aminopeptidase [Armatimonadetes bacterium]|nr:aminopeptidase [Armatimonadota bacterium]